MLWNPPSLWSRTGWSFQASAVFYLLDHCPKSSCASPAIHVDLFFWFPRSEIFLRRWRGAASPSSPHSPPPRSSCLIWCSSGGDTSPEYSGTVSSFKVNCHPYHTLGKEQWGPFFKKKIFKCCNHPSAGLIHLSPVWAIFFLNCLLWCLNG